MAEKHLTLEKLKAALSGVKNYIDGKFAGLKNPDWNQNDETAVDYIENRPFYTTDPVDTVIFEEQEVTDFSEVNGYYAKFDVSIDKEFDDNNTYTVIFDGVTYKNLTSSNKIIGSQDGDFSVYPFQIYQYYWSGPIIRIYVSNTDTSTSHTICITEHDVDIVELDEKYISYKPGLKVTGKTFTINGEEVTAGNGAEIFNGYASNVATGEYSCAIGVGTVASGARSCARGLNTTASAGQSSSEGQATTASGMNSHAEGSHTTSSGFTSHSEGNETVASGNNSHSEGNQTEAKGNASHAEGNVTCAEGDYSHTEGYYSYSKGLASHAEGGNLQSDGKLVLSKYTVSKDLTGLDEDLTIRYTTAYGIQSHAEGSQSLAYGYSSHSEGHQTKALGDYSHVQGVNTVAASNYQYVSGKYNTIDVENKYAHILGNGESDSARSNAHTLDWDGNAEFAGDVIANGCGGDSPISLVDVAAKVLPAVTSEDAGKFLVVQSDGTWAAVSISNAEDMSF